MHSDEILQSFQSDEALNSIRKSGQLAFRAFMTQLADDRYSSWDVARLWGLQAYTVTLLRRVYCEPTIRIHPDLRFLVLESPVMEIKDKPEEKRA